MSRRTKKRPASPPPENRVAAEAEAPTTPPVAPSVLTRPLGLEGWAKLEPVVRADGEDARISRTFWQMFMRVAECGYNKRPNGRNWTTLHRRGVEWHKTKYTQLPRDTIILRHCF